MRILIPTIGSAGDVHPYVAVALALKARGHEPVMLTNPYFKPRILAAGVGFWPLGTEEEYLRMIRSPELVKVRQSPSFVFNELLLGTFMQQVEAVREAVRTTRPEAVFMHHICFGAVAACEGLGVPMVQGVLAPLFWLSREEKIAFPTLPVPDAPMFVHTAIRWLMRRVGRWQFDRPINARRKDVGVPPIRDCISRSARGGDGLLARDRLTSASQGIRTLGLWSEHFRPRRDDDPITGTICGFCSWDRPPTTGEQLDAEREVLRWMDSGERPVLITLGSSVSHHGADVYDIAEQACRANGVRTLLLVGGNEQPVPASTDQQIRRVPYVAYSPAMARASMIVHHAGIGTTAATMRSGSPSVILPFVNDEFDNSVRARRLGVAEELRASKLTEGRLAEALRRVLNDRAMNERAAALGAKLRAENGAERAAKEIESFVSTRAAATH